MNTFPKLASITKPSVIAFGLCIVILLNSCAVYNDVVLDNQDHGLPCTELPSIQEVEQIVASHQDVIQKLEAVNPGQVFVDVDSETCPDHADIIISYASHQDREAIEELIGADTFFGIPYRLRNN